MHQRQLRLLTQIRDPQTTVPGSLWARTPPGPLCWQTGMTTIRSLLLFTLAALAEIGGAWLIWQSIREHKPAWYAALGVIALGAYGFVAAFQPDANFGRVLAAYGGVFVAGSLGWAVLIDQFRPDRYDLTGALICLAGVAVIMYAPRG